MRLNWSPLVELIRRHRTFLLVTHERPDADGMGSQLALADALGWRCRGTFLGVGARSFTLGEGLSGPVAAALPALTAAIEQEVEALARR